MAYEQMVDIRSKVQWAAKRIEEFKIELRTFLGKNPYSLRIEDDLEGGDPFVHIIKADPVPPEISLLAGDVFQNLRSALDYLVCALVRANGKTVDGNSFPIFDHAPTSSADKRAFRRKVEGIREEIIQVIGDTHPYQGGDNKLWRLHRLNNIDKHNLLVAAWGGVTAVNGLPPIVDQWIGNRWVGLSGVPFPLKEGDKFTPNITGVKVDKNTSLFLEVALNEVGVAEGYPLILALNESFHAVRDTVGRFSVYLR